MSDLILSTVNQTRERIASWLLHGPMQMMDGPHQGGIAGWLNEQGVVQYVYGEITGYYLHWLASYADRYGTTPLLKERAAAARNWLARQCADNEFLPTRVYLQPADDWRNKTLFCFDLAMILRGLAAAAATELCVVEQTLLDKLSRQMSYLIAPDGLLRAHYPMHNDLPKRWSTERGAFLAKAAQGIVAACDRFKLPAALRDSARATVAWLDEQSVDTIHYSNTHALLYYVEGIIAWPEITPNRNNRIQDILTALLGEYTAHAVLPEDFSKPGKIRADVHAQLLRAACCIKLADQQATLAKLAASLLNFVRNDGAVLFEQNARPVQLNVWCAIFCEQALACWVASATDNAKPLAPSSLV